MKSSLILMLELWGMVIAAQTSTFTYDANGNQLTRSRPAFSYLVTVSGDTTIQRGAAVTLYATGGDNYLWSTGATTASITVQPDSSSTYGVTVHCICGAIITDTVRVEVEQVVGTAEPEKALTLELFPNPVTDAVQLRIQLPCTGDAELQLFDESGRLWWQRRVAVAAGTIRLSEPVSAYPPGGYLFQLRAAGRLLTKRFTIIH